MRLEIHDSIPYDPIKVPGEGHGDLIVEKIANYSVSPLLVW